ncbi:dihydrolipoamide acetyltransferase family protein [Aphanothece sacrum]|uniref:Dihydrolipoamide acetyltransferase component of pyruvate dehydrogenase complex n=1 Tax=Aphanothece sacrum FPU1 TaxID=1920663 RepID=A0A401II72_APHSA|nr:dihydrolipoamide acetyltransferase family protein [Aphanothece sacrum]GBF80997.1 dihydrolipoamide acetyltransferase component of pyruvate dehydrogenase complex [Aphanothece sacrum FPU1]GBF85304.1 dihydrolipoamide acetyltransferase component [Aphanothece sacrum FPU3]
MIHDIFMPALSSTMTEGKIVSWVKSPGDKVEKGETVVVVESDKADMDVESFYEGYLAIILVEAGQEAPVGNAIALIAETQEEITQAQQKAPSNPPKSPEPSTTHTPEIKADTTPKVAVTTTVSPSPNGRNGRIVASPRAKKLAQELKVNLHSLQGSGPYGRIVAEDVELAAGKTPTSTVTFTPPTTPVTTVKPIPPTPTPVTAGETVPLTTFQKALVQNMVATLGVPTFHVGYTITTDGLDKLYKQIKSKGVTMTALLAKAVAVTLQKHPLVNANYTDQGIQYPQSINIAIAVAMPDGGLITPVLQNADQVDIYSLSRIWKELVERARAKQLQPQEYNSGTFTLSNLGMFGVDRFDAILPPGQGSILAIGASRPQVVATSEGLFGIQRQMAVNITCDHRVIYGSHAAAFLQDLAKLIETNAQSLTM